MAHLKHKPSNNLALQSAIDTHIKIPGAHHSPAPYYFGHRHVKVIPFSAFRLRSSVVSVLISLIADIPDNVRLLLIEFFSGCPHMAGLAQSGTQHGLGTALQPWPCTRSQQTLNISLTNHHFQALTAPTSISHHLHSWALLEHIKHWRQFLSMGDPMQCIISHTDPFYLSVIQGFQQRVQAIS